MKTDHPIRALICLPQGIDLESLIGGARRRSVTTLRAYQHLAEVNWENELQFHVD